MRDKLDQLLAKTKEINEKLSKRNRIIIIACIAAVLVVAGVSAFMLKSNSNSSLFTEIAQAEAVEIMGKIEEAGVTGATYSDGTIYVPANQADTLRAQLVMQGYPSQGLTYDTFTNNVDMMSTDLDREIYEVYDLQDRIASTIRHFSGVEDAIVFISTGNDGSSYVLSRDRHEPSASVTMLMKNNGSPTAEQVKGVQRLVAFAYPGMTMENVAVIDGMANDLTEGMPGVQSGSARLKIDIENDIERDVQAKVATLLNSIYGAERVRISVNAVVDVTKKIREIITYLPSTDENNRGVIQREQTGVEAVGQGSVTYGVPGPETNSEVPIYPNITSDGTEIYYVDDQAFDYLVSQVKEQIEDEGGEVLDLSVGVALDEERLSRTDIDNLKQLIAQAAGIDIANAENKVSIVNATFATAGGETVTGILKLLEDHPNLKWILLAAAGLLLVLVVVLILMLRRAMAKKKRLAQEEAAVAVVEEEEVGETVDPLVPLDQAKKTREMELKQQIGEFADLNPEIAAQLIKTWLKGGPASDE